MPVPPRSQLTDAVHRLARARDDQQAWEVLFAVSWPTALATTHRVLRGQLDLAEDAAQEAFKRIVRSCPFQNLADGDAFLAYLRTVSKNAAVDVLNELGRTPRAVPLLGTEESDREPEGHPTPEQEVQSDELRRELLAVLDSVERRLLKMLIDDRTLTDIAAELNLSYSNAGVRVHRLRSKLRKYMQDRRL